jgi:hypothetical protein
MRQERAKRIQDQFNTVAATGNVPAAVAASARQAQIEAIRGAGGGLLGAAGMRREDPRLLKARKRETDKTEIMGILGQFRAEGSDGGPEITESELKKGFALLMERGYPQEAQMFMKNALAMQKNKIAMTKATQAGKSYALRKSIHDLAKQRDVKSHIEGPMFMDGAKRRWQMVTAVMKESGMPNKTFYIPQDGDTETPPSGELKAIQKSGLTVGEDVGKHDKIAQNAAKYDKLVNKHLYNLKEGLDDHSSRNAITNHLKKDWNTDKAVFTNKQDDYESTLDTAEKALAILKLPNLGTTGGLKVALNQIQTWWGMDTSGIRDKTTLNSFLKSMMMKKVKLLGTNPSNIDVKLTTESSADWTNSKGANIRILEDLIKTTTRQLDYMDHLNSNPKITREQFNLYKSKLRKARTAKRKGPKESVVVMPDGSKITVKVQ